MGGSGTGAGAGGVSDRTRKAMERIGLTGYEIKAFYALLGSGGLTASELSGASGVPFSKIYEVAGMLEEKGWAGSDGSRPTRYFAKSPSTGMDTVRQRMESDFARDQSTILGELVPLYEKTGTSERPDIWVLSGTLNIAAKILEMMETCRSEVMIAMPEAGEELIRRALPKLRLLHERGVVVTVLTSDRMDADSVRSIRRVATVRIRKGLFGAGIILDKRYVVILMGPEAGGDVAAIWADHAGLAKFARQYFEYLLSDSEKGMG